MTNVTLKETATLVLSLAALSLSIWNFLWASKIADRQHALMYAQDVAKWTTLVLSIHRRAVQLFSSDIPTNLLVEAASEIANDMNLELDLAALIFPDPASNLVKAAYELMDFLRNDHEKAMAGALTPNDAGKYVANRGKLIQYARSSTGVTKRYRDAQKYLA